jgi:hypothetical protein
MTRLWVALPLLLIVGCDQRKDTEPPPGSWAMVPAVLTGEEARDTTLPTRSYVWKMDTRTGEIHLCQYQDSALTAGIHYPMRLECFITENDHPPPVLMH